MKRREKMNQFERKETEKKDLEESFDKATNDFEKLQEDLDYFEECSDNLEVFIEDQHSMQFDGCLALLKQLKEIIADCEICSESYNDKYEANYEKYKEVRTLLTPFLSVWKKAEACRTIKIILRRNK